MAPADAAARQFLQLVDQNKPKQAYTLTSSAWQSRSSQSDFGDIADLWRKQVGSFKSVTQTGFNYYSGTGGAHLNLTYQVVGSRKSATVTMTMAQENGAWRVQAANFGL